MAQFTVITNDANLQDLFTGQIQPALILLARMWHGLAPSSLLYNIPVVRWTIIWGTNGPVHHAK